MLKKFFILTFILFLNTLSFSSVAHTQSTPVKPAHELVDYLMENHGIVLAVAPAIATAYVMKNPGFKDAELSLYYAIVANAKEDELKKVLMQHLIKNHSLIDITQGYKLIKAWEENSSNELCRALIQSATTASMEYAQLVLLRSIIDKYNTELKNNKDILHPEIWKKEIPLMIAERDKLSQSMNLG